MLKHGIGICVVIALALPCEAQRPAAKTNAADYYPLKTGTTWTYQVETGDGKRFQMSARIAKIETIDGQALARLEATINGTIVATEHLKSTPEGVFRCRYNGVEVTPPLLIFKYPFKEDATWNVKATIGAETLKGKFSNSKVETITTPAGKYAAAQVTSDIDAGGTMMKTKFWFAPDVGIVKQDVDLGKLRLVTELVKVELPK